MSSTQDRAKAFMEFYNMGDWRCERLLMVLSMLFGMHSLAVLSNIKELANDSSS